MNQADRDRQRARQSESRGAAAGHDAQLHHDSAERRAAQAQAQALEAKGIPADVASARMYADAGVATHATEATIVAAALRGLSQQSAAGRRSNGPASSVESGASQPGRDRFS